MKITKRQLRRIIREEVLREAGDDLSNADFIKGIKSGASDLAGSVPPKLNNDMAGAMKALAAMAQYDKSKFLKIKGLIDSYAVKALEKASKGNKSTETSEEEGI